MISLVCSGDFCHPASGAGLFFQDGPADLFITFLGLWHLSERRLWPGSKMPKGIMPTTSETCLPGPFDLKESIVLDILNFKVAGSCRP